MTTKLIDGTCCKQGIPIYEPLKVKYNHIFFSMANCSNFIDAGQGGE